MMFLNFWKKFKGLIILIALSMGLLFVQIYPYMGGYIVTELKGSGPFYFEDTKGRSIAVEKTPVSPKRFRLLPPITTTFNIVRGFFICNQNYYFLPRFVWNDKVTWNNLILKEYVIYNPEKVSRSYIFSRINVFFAFLMSIFFNSLIFYLIYLSVRETLRPLPPSKYQRSLLTQRSIKRSKYENKLLTQKSIKRQEKE